MADRVRWGEGGSGACTGARFPHSQLSTAHTGLGLLPTGALKPGAHLPGAALTLVSQSAVTRPFSTVTSVEKELWE